MHPDHIAYLRRWMRDLYLVAFEVKPSGFSFDVEGRKYREILIGEVAIHDLHHLLYSIYAMKDNLKRLYAALGMNPSLVEASVDESSDLAICIDLHNAFKHGGLDRGSRSGKYPKMKGLSHTFSLKSPARGSSPIQINFQKLPSGRYRPFSADSDDPDSVEKNCDVVDVDGQSLGDLFDIAAMAISVWEKLIKQLPK